MKKLLNLLLVVAMLLSLAGCGNKEYKEGSKALEAGDYMTAIQRFDICLDYEDASAKRTEAILAQLKIYAETMDFNSMVVLLADHPLENPTDCASIIKDVIKRGLNDIYTGVDDSLKLLDFCQEAMSLLTVAKFTSDSAEFKAIKGIIDIQDEVEYLQVYATWYPNAVYEINGLWEKINSALDTNSPDAINKAGYEMYKLADSYMNNYGTDVLSLNILMPLRDAGDCIMKLSSVKTEAQAEKIGTEFGEALAKYLTTLETVIEIAEPIEEAFNNLNFVFGTSLEY